MPTPIYLDYHASTPVLPEILQEMLPYFTENYGNAANKNHKFGWLADEAVEQARKSVAQLIGAQPRDIFFTSGATESNNLALCGVIEKFREFTPNVTPHLITSNIEHKSVLNTAQRLEKLGCEVTYVATGKDGVISVEDIEKAIKPNTVLISLMMVNNEIGTIQPIQEIGKIARERKIYFHTDAVQSAGKIPIQVEELQVDLLSLSAHKIYGPKGVGALYIRQSPLRVKISSQMTGGSHERGIRSGTLNVPGIVGLGLASKWVHAHLEKHMEQVHQLKQTFLQALQHNIKNISGVRFSLNGHAEKRIPHNLNLTFHGVNAARFVTAVLKTLAVSTGSACSTAAIDPSHVLKAIGRTDSEAHSTLRLSLGHPTTAAQLKDAAQEIYVAIVQSLPSQASSSSVLDDSTKLV